MHLAMFIMYEQGLRTTVIVVVCIVEGSAPLSVNNMESIRVQFKPYYGLQL